MQRKRLSLLWIMLMLCVLLSFVAEAKTKKPSTKALKSAYKKYISKNISSQNDYRLYDLNKDGIKECIICSDHHPRYYRLTILTYKNKKVICMLSTITEYEILFSKKKGQICISSSSGAGSYAYELYKVKAKRLLWLQHTDKKMICGIMVLVLIISIRERIGFQRKNSAPLKI